MGMRYLSKRNKRCCHRPEFPRVRCEMLTGTRACNVMSGNKRKKETKLFEILSSEWRRFLRAGLSQAQSQSTTGLGALRSRGYLQNGMKHFGLGWVDWETIIRIIGSWPSWGDISKSVRSDLIAIVGSNSHEVFELDSEFHRC